MRLLDTREQKSPRFLVKVFPDLLICEHLNGTTGCGICEATCPFVENWEDAAQYCADYKPKGLRPLEVGDYFSGDRNESVGIYDDNNDEIFEKRVFWRGNLVEIKLGPDFGIHTEHLERFQDECYRMACYRQKNPHVQLHAVWVIDLNDPEYIVGNQTFYNICFTYHIWGHIKSCEDSLVYFLKSLDQTSRYVEFEPFIKRSHEEATLDARMIRQYPGISSEKALLLADYTEPFLKWFYILHLFDYNQLGDPADRLRRHIYDVLGRKKDGSPYKLAVDFINKILEDSD